MLDHVLGRPSSAWKRAEVLVVAYLTLRYLKSNINITPPYLRYFNSLLRGYRPWQVVVLTLLARYVGGRIFLLLFLNAPEVYSKSYNRNFYRATWILTALDAGYWTAMNIRPRFVREIVSVILSIWYLFQADAADIKVRKIRSDCSVKMMRLSWEKGTSPILWAACFFQRPWLGTVKELFIKRDDPEDLTRFPQWRRETRVKIYYAGKETNLKHVQKLVLHFPGGGFITMSPENHEEYIRKWAKTLGTAAAICSVDYGKAPEFPYPYAVDECFELYKKICETDGRIIGLNCAENHGGKARLHIAVAGDSAGGNLTVAVTIKSLEAIMYPSHEADIGNPLLPLNLQLTTQRAETGKFPLRKPDGVMVIYGALNFDMASWIAPDDSHAQLLRLDSDTSLSGLMKNYKGKKYHETRMKQKSARIEKFAGFSSPYLSLTSRVAYFNDRIIPPELARAMSLLYLGSNSTVNPATDYYLSPVNTPDEILMEFPRVWMMCGECDPFVDDTVVFAARVRNAISRKLSPNQYDHQTNRDEVDDSDSSEFEYEYGGINRDPFKHVAVKIYAGLSHAYLQMLNFLPEAHHATSLSGEWLCEIFELKDRIESRRLRRKRKVLRMEMRDEDNIPDEIDLPLGAEYRVGGTHIQLRHEDEPSMKKKANKNKYQIGGDSDQETEIGEVETSPDGIDMKIFDDVTSKEHPLLDAMFKKKYVVTGSIQRLAPMTHAEDLEQHEQKVKPKKNHNQKKQNDELFLSEGDLLSKRRDLVEKDVYKKNNKDE